ncbi:DoxX family protein [Dongia soli]|uniref:DoxX family protein n=1 Tax=Dongia soli TaxID=600628 RepID=A0ABU5EAF1_9PROT|nr:DoxX family protein [Dongia soli]MDY0883321.1 DoxX family protein [Dongia soli]
MAFRGKLANWLRSLEQVGGPIVDLLIRIAVFRVFFWSGLVKIHDWEGTVQLFQYEYMVPFLSPSIAALLATSFELGASSLVLLGFLTRLAALPLLGMAMVIQFVLGAANPDYSQLEHYLWMVLLLSIIVRGPGLFSIDYLFHRPGGEARSDIAVHSVKLD